MRAIIEGVEHTEVARIPVHFPEEHLDGIVVLEVAVHHGPVPSCFSIRKLFVVVDSALLQNLITEELGERVSRIVTARQHHTVEELLEAENVALDELGRRTDDLARKLRNCHEGAIVVEAELVNEQDGRVECHHLSYAGDFATLRFLLACEQTTSTAVVNGPTGSRHEGRLAQVSGQVAVSFFLLWIGKAVCILLLAQNELLKNSLHFLTVRVCFIVDLALWHLSLVTLCLSVDRLFVLAVHEVLLHVVIRIDFVASTSAIVLVLTQAILHA